MTRNIQFVLQKRWGIYLLILLFLSQQILFKLWGINTFLPCPIKNIFDTECLGCGLNRCASELLSFQIKDAYNYHKIGVFLLPLIILILIIDLKKLLTHDRTTQK